MTKWCEYCGVKFARTGPHRETMEHLMPRSMGGRKKVTIPVCSSCNHARQNSTKYRNFLIFVKSHPMVWNAAVDTTRVNKFKQYIGDHPERMGEPIIRDALRRMERRGRTKCPAQKRTLYTKGRIRLDDLRSQEAAQDDRKKQKGRITLYGVRSQEARPKLIRDRCKKHRCSPQKQQHESFENDSRQVEITMIRSRIRGAIGKNKRVLKSRLKKLNLINWNDYEEKLQQLRKERMPE